MISEVNDELDPGSWTGRERWPGHFVVLSGDLFAHGTPAVGTLGRQGIGHCGRGDLGHGLHTAQQLSVKGGGLMARVIWWHANVHGQEPIRLVTWCGPARLTKDLTIRPPLIRRTVAIAISEISKAPRSRALLIYPGNLSRSFDRLARPSAQTPPSWDNQSLFAFFSARWQTAIQNVVSL